MKECIIKQEKGPGFYFSVRFMVACLIFCASAIQYTQKIDMSIGIVCMVNKTALTISDKLSRNSLASSLTDTEEICMFSSSDANNGEANDGPFIWSKRIQGLILSSYFYGYIILQIPSGWLSKKIGGQRVLGISMFLGSLMTLLVPFSAKFGYHSLIICRFLNGLVHGAVFPAVCSIFVKWAPPAEKSRLIGFACSGSYIGNVIALPLGSFLCMHGFDGGWPSIFYFFGVVGIAWCGIFMYLTSNSPKNHHFITRAEREYIAAKISPINSENSNRKIPWSLIIKSKACLALFSSNFCANWANYLFLTQLPSFMNDILKFDIKSNGLYSTLPYITCWFVAITSAVVSDQLIASKSLSTKNVRKLFNTLGFSIGMISMFLLSFVTCANPFRAVFLLTIGLGAFGMCTGAGFLVNINEIGGDYAGILCGISNTIATLPGILAPLIVGIITSNKLQSEWQIVFLMSCLIFFIGGLIFLLFSESEPFYETSERRLIKSYKARLLDKLI